VEDALAELTPQTHATALELLQLPDVIRGYEEIKLRNVVLFRRRVEALRKRLSRPRPVEVAHR
jgi:indolepyruvate ferredoxin oxidoreductase